MSPTPRWGALPWFVVVLTLLLVLLVAVLPPLILDETPPAWVLSKAARVASWHGDPDPVEAEWFVTTRAEAARLMEAPAADGGPAPDGTPTASPAASPAPGASPAAPSPAPSPVEEPDREVYVVVMRGGFDSAPPGGPPPPGAPERWMVVAYDALSHERWRIAVLDARPDVPAEAAVFEF